MTGRRSEHPAVDVLRLLGVSRSSGALEIRGARSGVIFLNQGFITFAEASGIPSVPESEADDPQFPSIILSAVVEAGLTLLTDPQVGGDRPLFRPGRQHWTGLTCRIEVEYLLARINDELAAFSRLGVPPDEELQLVGLPRGRGVVLTLPQWAVAVQIRGPQTALSLARLTGNPLADVVGTLAALKSVGVVRSAPSIAPRPAGRPTRTPKPPRPVLNPSAAAPVRPAGDPPPVPLPPVTLPHRVAGATTLPSSSQPRRRVQPMPESTPDSRQAIAIRVLEGLRRL